MIVYNVVSTFPKELEEEWTEWMKSHHIPNVMKTGYFNNYRMYKIIIPSNSSNEVTYSMQYDTESLSQYIAYTENEGPRLKNETMEKFGDVFIAARTVLEQV